VGGMHTRTAAIGDGNSQESLSAHPPKHTVVPYTLSNAVCSAAAGPMLKVPHHPAPMALWSHFHLVSLFQGPWPHRVPHHRVSDQQQQQQQAAVQYTIPRPCHTGCCMLSLCQLMPTWPF